MGKNKHELEQAFYQTIYDLNYLKHSEPISVLAPEPPEIAQYIALAGDIELEAIQAGSSAETLQALKERAEIAALFAWPYTPGI